MRARQAGRLLAAVAGLLAATAALTACASSDGLASKYGDGSGYVSGDGQYTEIPVDQREAAVRFGGPTVDGTDFSSDSIQGRITVVNFWYAGCPPCRLEAPYLASLSKELTDVQFVGVNVYDDADVAKTFDTQNGIDYPSILDVQSGSVQLAFAGDVAPNAVPSTLVLDKQGRVAARVSGLVQDPKILRDMIQTVEQEG